MSAATRNPAPVEPMRATSGPPPGPRLDPVGLRSRAARMAGVFCTVALCFTAVAGQLLRLGLSEQPAARASVSRALSETFARPDIIDSRGNLFATDVVMQSLYADPSLLLSAEETLEALEKVLPGIGRPAIVRALQDRKRRFVWLRRGLSPATAQRIHELGLPGLDFRAEPKRSYPQGRVAGHLIGNVNIDNKGIAGIERYIDDHMGLSQVLGDPLGDQRQLRLTIDLRAQAALEDELARAMQRYGASAASAVIMNAASGAVGAAASLPTPDPSKPSEAQHLRYLDRLTRGTYELGSIFKALTIAMALERRTLTTRTRFDVSQPIELGRHRIADHHDISRPMTVAEIFVHSSNVGAGRIALEVGEKAQRAFLEKLGLLAPMSTDIGTTATPLQPDQWGRTEVVTVAYGHGLAVAPLQFAAAGAALVNGGFAVKPRFVMPADGNTAVKRVRVLSEKTSRAIRRLMKQNVALDAGSGGAADVPGYDVGGKTGTADRARDGRYDGHAVVTSFFAAFPIEKPQYVVLVTLHDPKGLGPKQKRSAATNAAPTTGRIIRRVAPLLGVLPGTAG